MIVVVFIGGFLNPEGHIPYNVDETSEHIRVIPVYPSSVSSLHDRVCQIFYELKGGTVHYGVEHSEFHNHSETGDTYDGKIPEWSAENPIHIIGHSFGGVTARVLHAYLADGDKFTGYRTHRRWIVSVNTIAAPLNGSLMVYSLGASTGFSPVVRWGSPGFCVGLLAHISEFIDSSTLRNIHDFKLKYWNLSWHQKDSFLTLLNAFCGLCIHSTTDNAAYDMTIHSQLEWADYLSSQSETFYSSVVGTSYEQVPSLFAYLSYLLRSYLLRPLPLKVLGLDTSDWLTSGYDGLLSARTQEFPFLTCSEKCIVSADSALPKYPESKIWYVSHVAADHVGSIQTAWRAALDRIVIFSACNRELRQQASVIKSPVRATWCTNLGQSPDKQIPSWTLKDRPKEGIPFFHQAAILSVCLMILAEESQQEIPHALLTLFPHLLLTTIVSSSDGIELTSALIRCAFLISMCYAWNLNILVDKLNIFGLYISYLVSDAAACLCVNDMYEYSIPSIKAIFAAILQLWPHSNKYPNILLLLEILTVVAKFGWFLGRTWYVPQLKWSCLWCIFWCSTCALLYHCVNLLITTNVVDYLLAILLLSLCLIVWFVRIRDVADAFQVEHILTKQLTSAMTGPGNSDTTSTRRGSATVLFQSTVRN